ncbi:bifunctional phosphoribosylaminoimidazolecarboxamide formyltransferase/IMP cyclohydrolase [Ferruginibacter sp. HRS2-29]|uniref:bifunctional phosphoribosylaminoimidazolecarboxamide formyltransferase/IMP cyclohydrolase n=1 Tax=Ferruginibacter sp. HRS2-29 TaxID=2487334 RepID=UPI0020CC0E43|nr:bifunctional phosphoribosylaminoimidazolecarboxamide formyltransferase/IMP cyclohydrolase [Ferruginibacter sp. HRS2-29]MCP9752689.1 bifunctional phosphoribosylaminoimidazolecarboxamide formyltransferase/IMP cyclohydrolase PurH [Ferruginibacter sp. HRS2-29]
MQQKIKSALISVFYKDGLENIVKLLDQQGVTIYSTGGTQDFIEKLGVKCVPVESLTSYPSILGGRVKTLHPSVFGGILGKREDTTHLAEMAEYKIPEIDLVIVDLYPFEETVKSTTDESLIIEKIDIGGPSMIRAAAKNHQSVVVVAAKKDYSLLEEILASQNGETTLAQRRTFAIKAFDVCTQYDTAISSYFNGISIETPFNKESKTLRYGENPHQSATYFGNLGEIFTQLHGKELSYNNLVDVDAAIQLSKDLQENDEAVFAIIKHNNVCGVAIRGTLKEAWDTALAGDPESAFGGVLVCNKTVDPPTANAINELFFEVLIAPAFDNDALEVLKQKKNRILLQVKQFPAATIQYKSLLNGMLLQQNDEGNYAEWKEVGGRESNATEKEDLVFANIIAKHLKSNSISLVKNKQMIGKGCGQTSRIDSLRQAIEKAKQFGADLNGAVLGSDAFFPFDDCVKIAHQNGIGAFIQPGGSIRDADSIAYCKDNGLVMVITGLRHFKH